MKYWKLVTKDVDGVTEYEFERTCKVTNEGVKDARPDCTGGTIFGADFNSTDFNNSVAGYCTRMERLKAEDIAKDIRSRIDEKTEKGEDTYELEDELISIKNAIDNLPVESFTDSPVARLLSFTVNGDSKCRFPSIGLDCMTAEGLISLMKEAYKSGNPDSMKACKAEVERFLTAHLKMKEDVFCKNINVSLSMDGEGGKRASFKNLLNASFAKTYRYSSKGITGKSMNDLNILKNLFASYFENVLTFKGKVAITDISNERIF